MDQVWRMLDHCLPGYEVRKTDHHWRIMFRGRTYATFPLGAHGRRKNVEVQLGHVRRMMRYFSDVFDCPCTLEACDCMPIDCARELIEQLR